MIAFITGSNLYDVSGFKEQEVATRFGSVVLLRGSLHEREVLVLPRHGPSHRNLPHHINHRANLVGLREAGATAIVSCSVCGVVNAGWPLATPIVAEDLFFPENRLPDGSTCTLFTEAGEKGRGHLLASSFFHSKLRQAIEETWQRAGHHLLRGVYGHVNGPRFNSRSEIQALSRHGVDFISQTCGPEAILANELELPYALAAFAVDYANGVQSEPTPVETLRSNLDLSQKAFLHLIGAFPPDLDLAFENFIYRFDS
jgi:5'-methylthioadenosine phosphorylase